VKLLKMKLLKKQRNKLRGLNAYIPIYQCRVQLQKNVINYNYNYFLKKCN
jgi:hypothetical protein